MIRASIALAFLLLPVQLAVACTDDIRKAIEESRFGDVAAALAALVTQEDPCALTLMAELLFKGQGVTQNLSKAFKLY
jgi:TPR repeat protein